jgi:hypothetical protein
MPDHAILITYKDMEKQMNEVAKKAALKYESFKQLYFDSGYQLSFSLRYVVDRIPKKDKLKIYISGHGGTGQQYITAEDRVRKQTVGELAVLLADGLINRATSMGDSANTEVNMVSCLFGRISSAGLAECPAVRLHAALATKETYVDLVARTEYVGAKGRRRVTMSLRHGEIDTLQYNKLIKEGNELREALSKDPDNYITERHLQDNRLALQKQNFASWQRPRAQFTKIRCTYRSGAAVVLIRDYDKGEGIHINSENREGRRILWADNVINELVKYITPPSGQTEVTDARHKTLYQTLAWYDTARDPEGLKARMEALISRAGGDDPAKNFLKDRGIGKLIPFRLPKTAQLIERLLRAYPPG